MNIVVKTVKKHMKEPPYSTTMSLAIERNHHGSVLCVRKGYGSASLSHSRDGGSSLLPGA